MSRFAPTRAAAFAALLLTAAACDRTPTSIPDASARVATRDPRNAAPGAGAMLATDGPRLLIFGNDPATAIISNGTIQLGVNAEGHLNVPGGTLSSGGGGTDFVGLRYVPTNGEATAPGCICEGWGAADFASGVTGYANESSDGGAHNMTVESFTSTATTALSVVLIHEIVACDPDVEPADTCLFIGGGDDGSGEGGGETAAAPTEGFVKLGPPVMRVTHDYHPSPSTPNLYEVRVTIENVSPLALGDVRYRRVMDWDISPNTFDEFVTIGGTATAANVLQAHNDGFQTANPLVINPPNVSPAASGDFVDAGPGDIGALFDFGFGALPAGESVSFLTFYGAAGTEAGAGAALSAVGAEVFSFGQPNWDGTGDPFDPVYDPQGSHGRTTGEPHTFIFAFKGVGGDVLLPPTAHAGGPYAARNEGQSGSFADGGSTDLDGSIVAREWNFGDGTPNAFGTPVSHAFPDNCTCTVTLEVTDDDGLSDTDTRSVLVRNLPPNVYRLKIDHARLNVRKVNETFWAEWFIRDPGVLDMPWKWTITWGDGSSDTGNALAQGESAPIRTEHAYSTPGAKTVRFSVQDKDGATHSRTITVFITP